MICKNCGRTNDAENKYCSYCNCILNAPRVTPDFIDINSYEADEGFSRPDSQYVEPQIINLKEIEPQEYPHPINHDQELTKIPDIHQELRQKLQQPIIYQQLQHEFPQEKYQERRTPIKNKFPKKMKLSRKSLIGMSVAILLIVFIIISLNRVIEAGEYSFVAKDAIEVYVDRNKMETYVFNTKGVLLHKIGQSVKPYYTKDHTAALLVSQNNAQSHYVNSHELVKLNTGMRSHSMSENGKYIVYSTTNGLQNFNLNLYDVDNHSEKVIDTITDKQYDMVQTLPDGKTITYITASFPYDINYMEYESFILKLESQPESLGSNIIVFKVSNDNKCIYYIDRNEEASDSIYVKSDAGKVLLSSNVTNNIFFNKDATEIMISDGDNTYISVNGRVRQQVADALVSKIVTPRKAIVYNNFDMGIYSYGFNTFQNKVILCNNNLKLIDDQYQSEDLGSVTRNHQIAISRDGTDLIYRSADRNLMMVKDLDGEWLQDKLVEAIDDSIAASNDLSKIYYLKDKQLYYKHNSKEPILITDSASNLCINQAGDTAYFLKDYNTDHATLFYSVNGGEAEAVPDSTGVIGLKEWNFGVIYQKKIDGKHAVFYSSKGSKFNLLVDGVDFFQQDVKYTE
ncbi:MAG: hypothetical protein K0S01_4141 [Herbinix sp.]|nr:hypothetical protein [Herbinix sp.]